MVFARGEAIESRKANGAGITAAADHLDSPLRPLSSIIQNQKWHSSTQLDLIPDTNFKGGDRCVRKI